jgi:hypothetical protein
MEAVVQYEACLKEYARSRLIRSSGYNRIIRGAQQFLDARRGQRERMESQNRSRGQAKRNDGRCFVEIAVPEWHLAAEPFRHLGNLPRVGFDGNGRVKSKNVESQSPPLERETAMHPKGAFSYGEKRWFNTETGGR